MSFICVWTLFNFFGLSDPVCQEVIIEKSDPSIWAKGMKTFSDMQWQETEKGRKRGREGEKEKGRGREGGREGGTTT